MIRPLVLLDIELYRNYLLLKFTTVADGRVRAFELFPGSAPLNVAAIVKILRSFTVVTFNGNNYDKLIMFYAIDKVRTNRQMKTLSDDIIVNKKRSWAICDEYNIKIPTFFDHIDLIEVAPGIHGLKMYGGRLHCKKLQDLPIEHDATIMDWQREILSDYCGNDLSTTKDLYFALKDQIDLRITMSAQYGVDLRSKSDAQIAEAVIKHEIEHLSGKKVFRPELSPSYRFKYKAPSYIRFESPELRQILADVQECYFYLDKNGSPIMPKYIENQIIRIAKGRYNLTIGGLHSMESSVYHVAEDGMVIEDVDVRSYYPNLILNNKWYPKHLGLYFLSIYQSLVDRRVAAKAAFDIVTDLVLKIVINGSFGKFGSKWSVLYSPDLMVQVTLSGQLSLLMLIEQFEKHAIEVVSANTDGIVTKYDEDLHDLHRKLVAEWEFESSLDMEYTRYDAIYSRDVNNYIAIKPDGEVKCKGAFSKSINIKKGKESYNLAKTPTNDVCIDAICDYLRTGKAIEDTIYECEDIRKFVSVRNVKGGAEFVRIKFDEDMEDMEKEFRLFERGYKPYSKRKGVPDPRGLWLRPDESGIKNAITMDEAYAEIYQDSVMREYMSQGRKRVVRSNTHKVRGEHEYLGKIARWVYATKASGRIEYRTTGNKVPKTDGCRPLMELPDHVPTWVDRERYIKEAYSLLTDLGVAA